MKLISRFAILVITVWTVLLVVMGAVAFIKQDAWLFRGSLAAAAGAIFGTAFGILLPSIIIRRKP